MKKKPSRQGRGVRGIERYTRRIIVARGDTHAGHDGGLVDPTMVFEVNGEWEQVRATKRQKKLWEWSERDKAQILALADNAPIDFIEMGDVTQGIKYTDDLQETNLSRQVLIAVENARAWVGLKQVVSYSAVHGTGVHVFGGGSSETLLTAILRKEYAKKNIAVASHYLLNFDGFLIDAAHHGAGVGKRIWAKSNSFDLYLKSLLWQALEEKRKTPHLVLRAHYHDYTYGHAHKQAGGELWEVTGGITPPYCLIGDHATKAGQSPPNMSVGTIAFEIINGRLHKIHPFLHTVDHLTERVL